MFEVTKAGAILFGGQVLMQFRSQSAAVQYLKRQPNARFWCW